MSVNGTTANHLTLDLTNGRFLDETTPHVHHNQVEVYIPG